MEDFLSICLGLGLAAAAGFRLFVPALLIGLGIRFGPEGLSSLESFPAWVGSTPALIALGAATSFEVGAYYFPWLDNVLDTIMSPLAVLAGILLFAGATTEMPPMWRWSLAILAGGTAAGLTQSATVIARTASSVGTGGLANFILATVELIASIGFSAVAAILAPTIPILLALGLAFVIYQRERAPAHGSTGADAARGTGNDMRTE